MTEATETKPVKFPAQLKWKQANPKAVWAQQALRSAVRRGLVVQEKCRVCGATDTEAHHFDYDMPMQVHWYCKPHHKAEHRRLKGGAE